MSTFSVFKWKYLVGKIWSKKLNCQFKLKFGMSTDLNMQNLMVVFISFWFRWEIAFWANLVRKIKIVTLSWNLLPRLIWSGAVKFSCFCWKYPFEANFILEAEVCYHKFQICRIDKLVTFFQFWPDTRFE